MIRWLALVLAALAMPALAQVETTDTTLRTSDGRDVKVRISWPTKGSQRLPLLVLSHGANGTLDGLANLQRGLTRGRIVAAPQHPDSEANPDLAKIDRAKLLEQRVGDMRIVLDSIPKLESLTRRRIDPKQIAAGGHSYGALIAQALGGAKVAPMPGKPFADWRDVRVTRVIAFSPPGPIPGFATKDGWSAMVVPQFVQTGTADVLPMIAPTWQAHIASFEASTVRGSALWVGIGVDHYFGNRIQRLTRDAPDQSAAFEAAIDLANAFLSGQRLRAPPTVTERLERR